MRKVSSVRKSNPSGKDVTCPGFSIDLCSNHLNPNLPKVQRMSLEFSIPLPDTTEHLDLKVGPLGGRKLTYQGRKLFNAAKLEVEGKRFKVVRRSYFANALPQIIVNKEEVQYFEPLPTGMVIVAVLTKIAMILGVINGVIFIIPGLLAFHLQQYLYRTMSSKSTAVVLSLVMMAFSWLIVIWGFYFWYSLLFG
jgi:hypothetical protein